VAADSIAVERQLREAATRLAREFNGVFDRGTIDAEVDRAYHRSDSARIRTFVPIFAYRFAREALRLRSRTLGRAPAGAPALRRSGAAVSPSA
jgi:hypothetical protein